MTTRGLRLDSCSEALVVRHDLVMLDLDGVVYVGPEAVPGAADVLREVRSRNTALAYVTNNASRPAASVAQHLADLGMPCDGPDDVVTAAQAVARLMAESLPDGASVLAIGGPGLREPLEALGLRCVDSADDAAAVVQGYHPTVGWTQLAEASYAVQAGVPWYASNTDRTIPTARGIAPGNGALVEVVATATGTWPIVAGKPERALFDETRLRRAADRPLMVGDRPDTDIDGAIGAELPSLLVLTGVADLIETVQLDAGHRPDHVAHDLTGLLAPHEPVEIDGDTSRCGDTRATWHDGELILAEGDPGALAALRAVVALGWATRDRGNTVSAVTVSAADGRMTP